MTDTSIFAASAIIPSKKNHDPHVLRPAMCIVSGDVIKSTYCCVAGKTGYCNNALALMLKICKYSLFENKSTLDLHNDADQKPNEVCMSRLQTCHQKGRGDTIVSQSAMDIQKTKLSNNEPRREGLALSLLKWPKQKIHQKFKISFPKILRNK